MVQAELYVTGIKELRAALRRADPALAKEFQGAFKAVAEIVAVDARRRVGNQTKNQTGRTKNSIRASTGGNTVYVIGGKKRTGYYGWLDFGGVLGPDGARRNTQTNRPALQKGRFIYPAISAKSDQITRAVADAFDDAMRKAGLS